MTDINRALFVAWQDPRSQRFFPVARLAQITGENCDDCFEFVYIRAALEAQQQGFLPFLSFPDLFGLYRSRELFPLFANRLLSSSRPDFTEYLEQLGLPPSQRSPLLILSRSGGRRTTDTLELFPLPVFEPGYGYRTWFWAHGLRHLPPTSLDQINALTPDTRLYIAPEPNNPVNPQAIALHTDDGIPVGYMPSYLLDDAQELHQRCDICEVFVDRVNTPSAPLPQRLLCRLESCWPWGFTPYSTSRYQPLPEEAAVVVSSLPDEAAV